MTEPILTIIVPAYNVEPYIAQCLDSCVNQTLMNHKIIIVNDGSTDGTEQICKEYAQKYPSLITYMYQENRGLGSARNAALPSVNTPYTAYLDSDDWINSLFVEKLTEACKKSKELPDIFFTLPWIFDTATQNIAPWMDKPLYDEIFSLEMPLNTKNTPLLYDLEVCAWRKIFRTDFLKDLNFSFPEGVKWEDVRPHFELLHEAKSCVPLKVASFYYRVNTGNQTTSGGGKTRLDMIPVFEDTLALCEKKNFTMEEKAHVLKLILKFALWSYEVTDTEYIRPLLKGFHKIFKKIRMREWKCYFSLCSPRPKRDSLIVSAFRSPFYALLSNRSKTRSKYTKLKNILRRVKK